MFYLLVLFHMPKMIYMYIFRYDGNSGQSSYQSYSGSGQYGGAQSYSQGGGYGGYSAPAYDNASYDQSASGYSTAPSAQDRTGYAPPSADPYQGYNKGSISIILSVWII